MRGVHDTCMAVHGTCMCMCMACAWHVHGTCLPGGDDLRPREEDGHHRVGGELLPHEDWEDLVRVGVRVRVRVRVRVKADRARGKQISRSADQWVPGLNGSQSPLPSACPAASAAASVAAAAPVSQNKVAQALAGWISGGSPQRQITPQAAPSSGQPRPIRRLGRAGRPHRPWFRHSLRRAASPPALDTHAEAGSGGGAAGAGTLQACRWGRWCTVRERRRRQSGAAVAGGERQRWRRTR